MPVIPFSSASRAAGAADDITERVEAEEARRYREAADAKLKELMNTPVKRFDPNGGTPMIDIPEPVTGGWRVRTNGDRQVNGDALPGGAFNRSVEPELDDPVRDEAGFGPVGEWTEDLTRPAAPEGDAGSVGMGSGGPGGEGGLSDQTISDIRDRFRKRKEGDSTRELRARMLNAPNADQAAIDADLAERQGVNRLEVERNRDTFVAVDRAQAIDDLRKTAPKLRAWLDYNPANLEVAHDDVESLGWWEQTAAFFSPGNLSIDKVGQALQSGFVDKIPEQLYGLDQMLGDANASIYKALPDWFPGKFGLVNEQVQRSLMADMKRQEMAAQGKANAPVGETWLERGIYGAAQSAPSTLVSLAITAVTKSPVVGSGSMGATTAGGAYGEARDEGKSLGDAFRYALTQGGIETATEFIPLKFLVDDLAKDSSFAKTFFRQAAAEGITEQAATFLQDASTFIELNPDKTLGEFLAERPNAALETLVASTIMSGVTTTVAKGMQAAGDQLDQNAKQRRAEDLAKFIDKAVDNGANSKLLKRGTVGADKYREAVAASTDAKFRIDSDAITALAQEEGVTVEQIAQAFRIDPDEMVTAIDTGSDVLVPVGNYVAAIQTAKKEIGLDGGAIHTALGPNMRVGENDLTAREQASMASAMEDEAKARTETVGEEMVYADAVDRVGDSIMQQVRATGRYNESTAFNQAELLKAIVTTLPLRTNQDPEALWKEQGFDIVASLKGEDTDPDGLAQSMSRQPVPIGDVELEFASKELSPQEFEAWKGARDGLSNEQIAERMNEVEPDAVVSSDDVKRWLFRSRERGYDSQKPHYNDRGTDPKTLRLIELRARGVKNPQIAAALYPDVDTQTAVNRVKALASKNKGKIEERRAALDGAKSLAQEEGSRDLPMDEGARMGRAREMGFDVDTLLYHGSLENFDEFSAKKSGSGAYHFSDDPKFAEQYAATKSQDAELDKSPIVKPYYIRGNMFDASNPQHIAALEKVLPDELTWTSSYGWAAFSPGFKRGKDDVLKNVRGVDKPFSPLSPDLYDKAVPGQMLPEYLDGQRVVVTGKGDGWIDYLPESTARRNREIKRLEELRGKRASGETLTDPERDEIRYLLDMKGTRDIREPRRVYVDPAEEGGFDTWQLLESKEIRPYLRKAGFDGAIATEGKNKTYVVFDRNNIRRTDAAFDPSQEGSSKLLAQTQRGTFTPREDRNVIRLFESANLSTLAHEGSHWYLDTLWRMSKTENPHPFVLEQLAAILEWHGKSPNWDAMFNPDGSFTKEGVDLQEAFAESFELYLREGKAPTTALRSVFASFKQWLLSLYKSISGTFFQRDPKTGAYTMRANLDRANLNDEIRQVFDRMLATDEAIKAVHTGLARDGEAMAKAILDKQDPDGKWKPERREKFMERMRERYAAARERAEAALMARLMDEFQRTKQAAWRDEERQVRREVQAEVDARPEQRAFAWLAGRGWRETAEDRLANAAATEAEAMLALAQADGYLGSSYQEAAEWISAREKGLDMSDEARAKRAKEMGFTKRFYHETQADPEALNEGFDTTRRQAATGDSVMPLGVFVKPGAGSIGIGGAQVELLVRLGNNRVFADRAELEAHLRQDAEYARMADEVAATEARYKATFDAEDAAWRNTERRSPEWRQRSDALNALLREWENATNVAGEAARVRATEVLKAEGLNSITVTKDEGSFKRAIKTTVVFNPNDLRSPNAAFDPDKSDSARLLAQGDGDWMGAFLDNYVENPSDRSIQRLMRKMLSQGTPPAVRLLRYDGKTIAFDGFNYTHDDAIQLLGAPEDAERALIESGDTMETVRWYDAGGSTLAQTVQPSRQLDAMGFYSAAQEAAQRVPDGIWQMGWQAARNSLAKGRDGIVPKKTEIEYLGLDAMFGDTKLKGAALKDAVLEHIAAKRLSLVENFARVDYNAKAPAKAVMLDEIDDDTLSSMIGLHTPSSGQLLATELDGATEFQTGLFMRANGERTQYDVPKYDLFRVLDGGKREVLGNGVPGDLAGIAARIIVNENRNLVMRKISAETMQEHWRESIGVKGDRTLVRGPGDIRLPGEDVPLFEAVIGLPEGVPGSDYLAPVSHVGGKAKGTLVTAHGEERIDDKGQRTVFVGQVQSDMAQEAREEKASAQEAIRTLRAYEYNGAYWVSIGGGASPNGPYKSMEEAETRLAQLREVYAVELNAPLLSTSEWTNVAVRAMIYRAAREGFQSISFPTAETSEIIQGNDSAAMHYETNVKGALEKLAKQLGGDVRNGDVRYQDDVWVVFEDGAPFGNVFDSVDSAEVFAAERRVKDGNADVEVRNIGVASAYILDITPAMRAKIMSEGFPLFQTGDDKGRATPPPNLPPMRLNLQAVRDQYGEQALAEIPPDVAAYSAEANDVEAYVQIARDVRKTLGETPPKSLWKFLSTPRNIGQGEGRISYRGIRDTDGELLKIIGEKKAARGLIADPTKDSKRSRSYDMQQAIEAAWEAGYFDGEDLPTPAEFLDTLRADIDGQAPRYRRDDIPTVSTIAGAERWKDWFEQNDMDITSDVATLRAKLATVLTGQGTSAIGPDEAAEVFNGVMGSNVFPTGFDLLKALKQGPLRDKLIRDLTEQRMIERNGDVFRDGTIMQEAEAYARNEVQHRQFEIELEALAEAAGKGTAGALAKQTAIENLRSKQVREVLNYTQWLTLERRWAEKAIKAAAKGDTAQAAEFARYRLINSHQYVEGKKLAEKIEKAVKHAKSFDGKDKRIRLSKAGPDYIQQIDQILEGYEFKPVSRKKEAERTSLREWFAAKQATLDPMRDLSGLSEEELMAAQQEEIERSDALAAMQADASVQNYKSLTVEELMAVSDQLDMIERMARKEGALLVEGERRLLSLALDDIEAQAIKTKPDELPPESYASYAPKEKNKRGFKEFFAELRTMQSIVRMIDGVDNGPLAKNTIQKLNQAGAEGVARLRLEEDRVVALFRAAYGINVDDLRKDQVRIPGVAVPLAKMERLTVALYMGTETSRKRMRDGYGWDDATLQSIINTLDAKDWAFVSSVWDYANSLYPEANQAHQDVFGVPLSKQPGLPIVTKFGVIQGNYFPLKYNPHQSSRADQQAITDTAKQITGRAGTRKATGSTKERVKGKVTMPVLLDFSITLGMHVNEVVGNITTQKAILDAGRIIAHPRTQKVIVSRHGWVTYKALMSAMRDTRNGLAGPRGPTERIMVRVRNGATNVALGLNIGTVIKQMLGYTTSIVRLGDQRTGPIAGAGWLLRGMVRMGFSASGMQNGTAFILQRSPYMRVRMQVMNQAIADQQRRINDGNIKADAKRAIDVASMFMMQRVQWLAVDGPTWLGAYEKFTASGMSEKDAAAGADQIVIDAQGSGEIFQVSAFQRGGPMQRIFTNYITAAIANWNLAVNTTTGTNFRNPGQAAIWAMNMGVLMVVPVIGSMAIGAMMSPGGGDEDEPLEEQYIREQVAFLIGPLGLFGQLGGAVGGFGYNGPQGTRAFEEASKVIMETFTAAERVLEGTATTKDAVDILRPANMAAGVWYGYPAAALDRFVRGAEALASGKTEDPKALLSGPPRE